jgi:hypothetical protein
VEEVKSVDEVRGRRRCLREVSMEALGPVEEGSGPVELGSADMASVVQGKMTNGVWFGQRRYDRSFFYIC